MLLQHASSPSNEQSRPDGYSTCALREEDPVIIPAPSNAPADISCHVEKPENVLPNAVASRTSVEGLQQELLASGNSDTLDSDSGQNSDTPFMERVNGHEDDAAADGEEEHVDKDDDNGGGGAEVCEVTDAASNLSHMSVHLLAPETAETSPEDDDDDDEQENDEDVDVYRPASEFSISAGDCSYMFAHLPDANAASSLPDVFEPTPDSAPTSGGYRRARVLDTATSSLVSGGTSVDGTLDGNSDESAADDSQSPGSESRYCAVDFFTNTTTRD